MLINEMDFVNFIDLTITNPDKMNFELLLIVSIFI